MNILQKVILEDMRAAIGAFDNNEFGAMNMYANRLMANSVFGDSKELFLPGFFLKEVANLFIKLKAMKKTPFSTAKTFAKKYLSSLKDQMGNGEINIKLSWISFFQFYRDLQDFFVSDIEKKFYTKNLEFSRDSISWIIGYLKDEKNILLNPNNLFFSGILNEIERIFRNHSGELKTIFTISLVRAMGRLYQYSLVSQSDKSVNKILIEQIIFPQIDILEELTSSDKPKFEEVTHALWILVKEWRKQFLKYMEPLRLSQVQSERAIEIPPEMKKKLTESVSKTLEKDIPSK